MEPRLGPTVLRAQNRWLRSYLAVDSIGDSQTAELAAKGMHSKLGQEIEDVNLDGWPQFRPPCFFYETVKSTHNLSRLINVLMIVSSFRIAAINASFFGLPFANSRW